MRYSTFNTVQHTYKPHKTRNPQRSSKPQRYIRSDTWHIWAILGKTFWHVHVLFVILSVTTIQWSTKIRRVFGTLATSKNGVYQFFYKRRNFHNSLRFVFFGLKWINKKHLTLFKSYEILRLISLTRQFQVRTENATLHFYYERSRVPRKNPKLMRTVFSYDAAA